MDMLAFGQPKRHFFGGFFHRTTHGNMDSPLDLTNVLEVGVEPRPIARTEILLENRKLTRHRVENACVLFSSGKPLFGAGSIAEQSLEGDTRIDFGGKRLRRRRPGDRVRIRAAVAPVAVAEVAGVLNSELNG